MTDTATSLVPFGWAPGNYVGKCHVCGCTHMNCEKRAWSCKPCAEEAARTRASEEDTQRAEASHPKPSEQTSEPSDPNLRSHPNLSRLIEAAERVVERASISPNTFDMLISPREYEDLHQALQPFRSGK